MIRRVSLRHATVALVAVACIVALLLAGRGGSLSTHSLGVEMQVKAGTHAQLFWSRDFHFVEERSLRVPLDPEVTGFQQLRFPLPVEGVRWLRFDPTDGSGEVLLRNMRLLDAKGRVLKALSASSLKAGHQIRSITQSGDVTRLITTPGANDPFVYATAFGCLNPPQLPARLSLVTPAALAIIAVFTTLLIGACLVVIAVDAFGRRDMVRSGRLDYRAFLAFLALFLLVFASKLLLVRAFPVTVPFWDQWDGEARALYIPFAECTLSWSDMFALHNEHRVFFSRVLALSSLLLNNQWDPRLQQVVNASIHALTAVLFGVTLWIASHKRLGLLIFATVFTFAAPFSWENTLFGFQSAFFFLLLFSLLAIWLTIRYRPAERAWYLGWMCAVCAVFSAAGGLLAPVAIVAVMLFRAVKDRRLAGGLLLTIAAALLVFGLGMAVAAPALPHHEVYRARSSLDLIGSFGRSMAWPWVGHPEFSVFMWAPALVLFVGAARRRVSMTALEEFVFGIGLWVMLQAAAIAYGRGAGAPPPAARYQDFLSLGFVTNAVAAGGLLERAKPAGPSRLLAVALLCVWFVVSALGVDMLVRGEIAALNIWKRTWNAHEWNVRQFVITGDLNEFGSKRGPLEIPYPSAPVLASLLQEPYIRRILPASVRQPVHMPPPLVTNDAFVPGGTYSIVPRDPPDRAWGSYTPLGNPARGRLESQPIAPCEVGGYLQFEVAGYLGSPHQRLRLRDLASGKYLEVSPGRPPREAWKRVLVSCPAGRYAIIALDGSSDTWFAFGEPVEVGPLSAAAESLIAISPELLIMAAVMAVLAIRRI